MGGPAKLLQINPHWPRARGMTYNNRLDAMVVVMRMQTLAELNRVQHGNHIQWQGPRQKASIFSEKGL